MQTSLRVLLALAVLGLVFGAIEFTPRTRSSPHSGAAADMQVVTSAIEPSTPCPTEVIAAGGVRHSRAFLYLLR